MLRPPDTSVGANAYTVEDVMPLPTAPDCWDLQFASYGISTDQIMT